MLICSLSVLFLLSFCSLSPPHPSTRVGKTTSVPIVLRNGGTVPVSVYFSMETHPVFSMEGKGRTINLRPKASERLMVTFNPTSKSEEGTPWIGELKVNTAQNEYGTTRITLRGVSYADDIGKLHGGGTVGGGWWWVVVPVGTID